MNNYYFGLIAALLLIISPASLGKSNPCSRPITDPSALTACTDNIKQLAQKQAITFAKAFFKLQSEEESSLNNQRNPNTSFTRTQPSQSFINNKKKSAASDSKNNGLPFKIHYD